MAEPVRADLAKVSLTDLEDMRGWTNLPTERDLAFSADKTIAAYAEEARRLGHVPA